MNGTMQRHGDIGTVCMRCAANICASVGSYLCTVAGLYGNLG